MPSLQRFGVLHLNFAFCFNRTDNNRVGITSFSGHYATVNQRAQDDHFPCHHSTRRVQGSRSKWKRFSQEIIFGKKTSASVASLVTALSQQPLRTCIERIHGRPWHAVCGIGVRFVHRTAQQNYHIAVQLMLGQSTVGLDFAI